MVNWQDSQVIEDWSAVLVDITFVMLGLYGWSYINSCQVESALLRRQLPFRWRMVPYLIGRTCFLVTLILSSVTSVAIPSHMDCYYVLKFLAFSCNIVVVCTSMNLVIRTWTVWKTNRFVCLFMGLIIVGHWFMMILNSKETKISSSPPTSEFCGFMIVNPRYSAATSLYTTILDFVLLKLAIFGYWRSSSLSLVTIIRTQGIILYFIVFFASVLPAIFSWLNLNYVMNLFFAWPATCVMTIASSYAVIPTFPTPQSTSHRAPVNATVEKSNVRIVNAVLSE
ncbi:uncharacterized protein F5147DRAFT_127162 [Suillus discolor]|uniref:Uncharacterized protein n=1 Tax=Suillus discolor TaxID=1912936 RepID=A0A9P7JVC3_9AGAM|nr:uncharacterized protein F5147DRAFT_127162 [Suillus discolor]KAG2110525.1 hypothetical protein F5147DRAFT_127162 [Suillus discolor]